ncbi:unnamed protein product [Pylaiella littoralis]
MVVRVFNSFRALYRSLQAETPERFPVLLADYLQSLRGLRTSHDLVVQLADFESDVVAWSFGDRADVIRSPGFEFELEVPDLGRNVPALIGLGLCSGSAETVDGKQYLLYPVLTCLASAGETFDPPLRRRFPVGDVDSMESGSDRGSHDDADRAYRAHLESVFSALTREDANSEWVPIDGDIVQADGGIFVLKVTVKHFCEFALRQTIDVKAGHAEPVPLPKLRFKSRESHYHFVNLGTQHLMVRCWGTTRKKAFLNGVKVNAGVGPRSGANVGGEVTRTLVDGSSTGVFTFGVPGGPATETGDQVCVQLDEVESLTVVWTTQEQESASRQSWWSGDGGHELVQVWGKISMKSKQVLVFGPELEGARPIVADLVVNKGNSVGKAVKAAIE